MPKANIHRRSTLEEIYPPDAFTSDTAQNGRVPNTLLSDVRILSAPDAAGNFDFERAIQQLGGAAAASFLAPHCRAERTQDAGRDSPTPVSAAPDPRAGYEAFLAGYEAFLAGYEAFLNDIIAVAQRFGFEPKASPGRDEPRLRGLRQ
jgi:hypothetical protein